MRAAERREVGAPPACGGEGGNRSRRCYYADPVTVSANGLGTAVWFAVVGAAVLAAGCALVTAKRWGRGLAVFTQLLLLPVAWYLAVGSHRPVFGIPLGMVALTVLILLFSPAAIRWASGVDQAGDQRDPASSANREPDTR